MISKSVRAKSFVIGMFSMISITPLMLSSSPGFAQSPAPAASTTEIAPVSPKEAPGQSLPQEGSTSKVSCRAFARVTSEPMPLPGQKHRSSGNFDLSSIRVGQVFGVVVQQNGRVNRRINFDIKRDIRFGIDPTIARDVKTGLYRRVRNSPLYPVYIANPGGAGRSSFTVTFCK
jgi:hypothetical protein